MLIAVGLSALGVNQCDSASPCDDTPMSHVGQFQALLFDDDLGGQVYGPRGNHCVNLGASTIRRGNVDMVQTVGVIDDTSGGEFIYILTASMKDPLFWQGGHQIIVRTEAAHRSVETGEPVVLDGRDGVIWVWDDGFWDDPETPQFAGDGNGTIQFTALGPGPGGRIWARYTTGLTALEDGSDLQGPLPAPRQPRFFGLPPKGQLTAPGDLPSRPSGL